MAKKTKKTEEITKKFGDERRKALDDALKNIEKDFGKGAVMRLGERAEQKVQVMSSGSLALDIALGAGGYPKGRIIEIYGPESSGKTTVALHAVASLRFVYFFPFNIKFFQHIIPVFYTTACQLFNFHIITVLP